MRRNTLNCIPSLCSGDLAPNVLTFVREVSEFKIAREMANEVESSVMSA